jgi:P27 family predicted phage terminase small subunit
MLVAELTATGAISQVDRAAIEMAARYGGYFAEAAEDVQKHGLTVSTKTGAKANPSIRARDDAARIRKTYLEALGLTPASRSRVSATPPDSAPTLEELLSGKADADGWIDRAETEKT